MPLEQIASNGVDRFRLYNETISKSATNWAWESHATTTYDLFRISISIVGELDWHYACQSDDGKTEYLTVKDRRGKKRKKNEK
ncbi:hypothetical protein PanWU01x14_174900 [Parasponia andersonii]|uniref:Uncharacterized protein n=1 Tax=Parasponia andersonii TaxID=3476 RepID=A0A2P5C8L8_PARAD|nr:hypothetical protein PanWU01x14_174900 [Parasponia andersonii]